MACYWLFLFSVNIMKGNVSIGSGLTVDWDEVHGHMLEDNEVALRVKSLKVKSFQHAKYRYNIEVGGYTAWNVNDIEVLS